MFTKMHPLIYAELAHHQLMVVRHHEVGAHYAYLKVLDRFGFYREVKLFVERDDDGYLYAELIDY